MYDLKQWQGLNLQEHLANYETAKQKGYAVLTLPSMAMRPRRCMPR